MTSDREFHFQPADFEAVKTLLYRRAGINLSSGKSNLVYSRLARRLRALGLTDFTTYLQFLNRNEQELEHFINALTTNHTSFFREPHHFETLANFASEHNRKGNPLNLWCAAASTGEEPWSLAMTLVEAFGSWTPPVSIIATDIDSEVLRHAQTAIYDITRLSGVSEKRRKQFFQKGKGPNAGKSRVVKALQKLVQFKRLNLLDSHWDIEGPFDVVFCRNVMIYFDKPTQLRLLEHMTHYMKPDGLYFAGHSESFVHAGHLVTLTAKSTYRLSPEAKRSVLKRSGAVSRESRS